MRKKLLIILLFLTCFLTLSQATNVFAEPKSDENKVVVREPTTDVDTLYKNYKDNSFELMTQDKEQESWTGVKESFINASGTIKSFTWGGVKGLGQFNAEMAKFLFSMDVVTPIKEPMLKLTSSIAQNMLSIAGTLGISFVILIVGIKFLGEQRFRQAIRVFVMAILIFTGLVICKDATANHSLFNTMFEADKMIETGFVKINPVLGDNSVPQSKSDNANERVKSAGDLIASRIFYTNVYEPYLLMNYGTSNPKIIRKKKVEYKDKKYDRINILLDNDIINDDNVALHDDVTKFEVDELKNRSIMYFTNVKNTFYGVFYFVVNLIQTVVYFLLSFLRLIIAIMQLFLLPLLPILLLVGLFMTTMTVFTNYFKVFGMTIFMKAMTGFACILFATFLSLGFQLSNAVDDPWQKILTILIYLLTPLGLYIFRKFLGSLFTGRVSLADAVGFATHPFSTERKMRQAAKERAKESKVRRKQAQEDRKAAAKKRQEKARKRGNQDIGLKQKPVKERENKRSALRREVKPSSKHKTPSHLNKAQQAMNSAHDKAKEQEVKGQQQLNRQRQRKTFDRENEKTAAALVAANKTLNNATKREGMNTTEDKQVRSLLQENNRRTGHSSKKRAKGQRTSQSKQGVQQVGKSSEIKQRQPSNVRSEARSQRRTSGQKPANTTVTPKSNSRSKVRAPGGNDGSPMRHKAPVRQKMAAVQQVINQQNSSKELPKRKESATTVAPPITRMSKRNTPPVRVKEPKNRNYVRRSIKAKPAPMKGMRGPRARK